MSPNNLKEDLGVLSIWCFLTSTLICSDLDLDLGVDLLDGMALMEA